MKLVKLVVDEMKQLGYALKWPTAALCGAQDDDGVFYFYEGQEPYLDPSGVWECNESTDIHWENITGHTLCVAEDFTKLLTKDVFEEYVKSLNTDETVESQKVVENNIGVETMRNRILIIDETLSSLKKERESLINRIREAGFEVIVPEVEQVEGDGSAWEGWEIGDTVKLINKCEYTSMGKDQIGVITDIDSNDRMNQNIKVDDQYWPNVDNLIRIKKKGQ